ncbi:ThiF family adenylyltransferase [Streptomyces boninensis]|uniref:ThiF family adenylyltransferase n=1 Tax=Streptomyces boninensis TaxID=2039455 RepID=UPI003B21D513
MLKPALRRAWRGRQTLQFGAGRAHAVKLGPVDPATGAFLELLDGTRGLPLLRQEAPRYGLAPGQADALLDALATAGLLDDTTGGGEPAARLRARPDVLERLRADHAALSVVHREPAAAVERLAARRATRVQVRGAGRVGATVATLLAAAGVGRVDVQDGGCVTPWETAPGGLPPDRIGERRAVAAQQEVRRWSPGARGKGGGRPRAAPEPPRGGGRGLPRQGPEPPLGGRRGRPRQGPEPSLGRSPGRPREGPELPLALVVMAPRDGLGAYAPDPGAVEQLMAAGVPHVYAGVLEGTGVVGPLVLPGESACSGCMAAERCEREPEWPRMVAQWRSGGRREGVAACDIALATMVAGLAAAHALTFLDGRLPPIAGARLECALPALSWETCRPAPHPRCGCGAAAEGGAAEQEAGGVHV